MARSDDDPRLAQPRARRIAPSNPSLSDSEEPWRKLGLFCLCGEKTDENPDGSTGLLAPTNHEPTGKAV